jgi:hypothetical protein
LIPTAATGSRDITWTRNLLENAGFFSGIYKNKNKTKQKQMVEAAEADVACPSSEGLFGH